MTTPHLSGSEPKVPKMAAQGPMAIAMRLRNQLQSVYKLDPLRNEKAKGGSACMSVRIGGAMDRGVVARNCAGEEVKLKIKDLNEHIVCYLCAGVLHRCHNHHRVLAYILQELYCEIPPDKQILPNVQHQNP
ncbi:hypothetical protein SKAU_G00033490 [Synaphobranchus kaupii]|uniref:Uncharacterized protein n=1 Tax=Synaphobranchus kaupii TaxID=118154 RepID=A0A9Q1JDE7_SYNKA|nr:hypothetical protein SKAU_G00033490 [Synaphobranchus kaupii]